MSSLSEMNPRAGRRAAPSRPAVPSGDRATFTSTEGFQ